MVVDTTTGFEVSFDFDFLHNTCWITNDAVCFPERVLEVIEDKKLIFNMSSNPVSSLVRIAKFVDKGYKIDAKELLAIAKSISNLPIQDAEQQFSAVIVSSAGDVVR